MLRYILLLLLFFPQGIFADIIYLKNRQILEGKIVEETKDTITLEIRRGGWSAQIVLSKDQIVKIERKKDPWEILMEEYKKRRKRAIQKDTLKEWEKLGQWCLEKKLEKEAKKAFLEAFRLQKMQLQRSPSAEGWYKLGLWCLKKGLRKQGKEAFQKAIQLNPDHPGARKALGYVRYQGKWIPEWEYEKRREEELRLKGYVKYKGKWYHYKALEVLLRTSQMESVELVEKLKRRVEELEEEYEKLEDSYRRLERQYDRLLRRFLSLERTLEENRRNLKWLTRYVRIQADLLENLRRQFKQWETGRR